MLADLERNGWEKRAAVVVIDPEFEDWVWSRSPKVEEVLGWATRSPSLRETLEANGFVASGQVKPDRPKEAALFALERAGILRSSALFYQLATRSSWKGCQDASFQKLLGILQKWFKT